MKNISKKEFDSLVDQHGEDLLIKMFPGYNTRYYVLLDTDKGFKNLGPVSVGSLRDYPMEADRVTKGAVIYKLELCPV